MAEKILEKIHYGNDDYIVHSPLVTQTHDDDSGDVFSILFSASPADQTTRTEGARKAYNFTYNPSDGELSAHQINCEAIYNVTEINNSDGIVVRGNLYCYDGLVIPVNPSTTPTENGAIWITT